MSVNSARVGRIPYDELGNGAGERTPEEEPGRFFPIPTFTS